MKKILGSVGVLALVGALVLGATGAFFSDTETSTGNTFTAGAIDLKVDNTCYYNKLADGQPNCPTEDGEGRVITSWQQTDLGIEHKFFWFDDVKPGDFGEDTISLHVDNDAWLRLVIGGIQNDDNSCTEPEGIAEEDPTCGGTGDGTGELQQNILFTMWLDQGVTPGFQGPTDLSECDNDHVEQFEPVIISEGPIDPQGEVWDLSDYQGAYLKAGETACFGVAWRIPLEVGNETQTDSMLGNMTFEVEQYRNNPTPSWND